MSWRSFAGPSANVSLRPDGIRVRPGTRVPSSGNEPIPSDKSGQRAGCGAESSGPGAARAGAENAGPDTGNAPSGARNARSGAGTLAREPEVLARELEMLAREPEMLAREPEMGAPEAELSRRTRGTLAWELSVRRRDGASKPGAGSP